MKRRSFIGCVAILSAVFVVRAQTAGLPQQPANASAPSAAAQRAILDQYCVRCHTQRFSNGIALDRIDLTRPKENAEPLERVVRKIRAGMMPPSGAPRPDWPTLSALAVWLENELDVNAVRHL